MSYLVTARKWRPKRFDEVAGQEHITRTLKNTILNNRIAHSYIFAGPRGVGKTTTARILAKILNCENPQNGEPCNQCEMCKAFNSSQSLDIIEIDGASNRRIEEIRSLRESVKYAPTRGRYKVYIIDEVHMLTTESFNALLKTLEEPPEHTIFIFATTDIHKVPLTIISRCQRFDFKRIDVSTIKNLLGSIAKEEGITIDDKSLTLIAKRADGALRDAQSLFDQVISFSGGNVDGEMLNDLFNIINEDIYFDLSDAIIEKNFGAAFNITQNIYDNGWNFIDFMNGLIEHMRNILTVVVRKNAGLIEWAEVYKDRYLAYKDEFSEADILRMITFLNKTQYELKNSSNERLRMELALSQLIGLERSSTISEILKRMDSGEPAPALPRRDRPETAYTTRTEDKKKSPEPVKQSPAPPAPTPEPPRQAEPDPYPEMPDVPEMEYNIPADDTYQYQPPQEPVSFSSVKSNWNKFINEVCLTKFGLGGLLTASEPVSLSGNKLSVRLDHPGDLDIINQDSSNYSFLSETAARVLGSRIEFKFSENPDALASTGNGASSGAEDTPLIKALKDVLGAKRM